MGELGKNVLYFIQRSELLAGLGEHRREGEMEAAKSTLPGTNQDLEGREVPVDRSAAGWEAAGLALGNTSKGLREEKPQSLNPKCDTVFQLLWSWRGSVPRNPVATTNTWPYTGKGESELLFSAT